jgi:hypothetical protein
MSHKNRENTLTSLTGLKAIETEYNGYRFRSRTEARWAVFFDHIGRSYEYEPQGFVLPSGKKYLPDFKFSIRSKSIQYFFEVKPTTVTTAELETARELALSMPAAGPPRAETKIYGVNPEVDQRFFAATAGKIWDVWEYDSAYRAASSARFEFGETPTPPVFTVRRRRAKAKSGVADPFADEAAA